MLKMKSKKEMINLVKRCLLVVLGSFILGFGSGLFLVPYDIIAGGVTGISIIINHYFPQVNISILIMIVNWVFFFIGWIFLGHGFAAKTIISAVVYPLSVMVGSWLFNHGFSLGDPTQVISNGSISLILASVFGGALVGLGVALTFKGGGSTGGVDVIILIFNKFTPIKASYISFFIDATVILIGFVVNSFDMILLGIVSCFISSIMINKFFDSEHNVVVNVISSKYKEINSFVLEKLDRGSTIIQAIGGYSANEQVMLQIVLNYREYYLLEEIIAKVDPKAFVYMTQAYSVKGEGFKNHSYSQSIKKTKDDENK